MVGLVDDPASVIGSAFVREGDAIVLLGDDAGEIGASEYLAVVHELEAGMPPRVDLAAEQRLGDFVRGAIRSRSLASAHDVSAGGVAVALAECCFSGRSGEEIGAVVDLGEAEPGAPEAMRRDDVALFSESQGRVIVTLAPGGVAALLAAAAAARVPARRIGAVGGDRLEIWRGRRELVATHVADLRREWASALPRLMAEGS
jgi:phosphoribosylformylglycinamidine synthase